MTAAVDHYLAVREELALPGHGLPWLNALRDRGAARFRAKGFPTLRDEDWRHTNVRPIQKRAFVPVDVALDESLETQLAGFELPGLDAHRVVFVDGHYSPALSDVRELPQGVTLEPLADALQSDPARVQAALAARVPTEESAFVALNTAFVKDGLYLCVADGCELPRPVEVIYFNTDRGGQLVQPRNLLIAGRDSRLSVVERYISAGGAGHFTNAVTELTAAESARVEHTRMQEESGKALHVGAVFVRLDAGARVVANNVALGSQLARTDVAVELAGEGSNCDLNGIYLANGRQHIDNFTQVDHRVPDCSSDEFYKGVLDERARAVFRGRIIVHQDAQQTDAQQQNRNLLLSEDAEIDTKPQLEIYADDVKCSHGATVGQLDENAMYYLRSRGIDEVTARSLLTYAFAADVIGRFELKPVRERVESVLSRKLFGVDRLEELV